MCSNGVAAFGFGLLLTLLLGALPVNVLLLLRGEVVVWNSRLPIPVLSKAGITLESAIRLRLLPAPLLLHPGEPLLRPMLLV